MRSDKQNTSVHAVATSIVFDRVSSDHLLDNGPQKSLAESDMRDLIKLTGEDNRCTRERYKIFLGKILCEVFPSFEFLKSVVPAKTPCRYQDEMGTESVVVPLPVLMKDEKKYAEVIDVLDQLEAWLHDLYSKAGLCLPPPPVQEHVPPGPPIAAPSLLPHLGLTSQLRMCRQPLSLMILWPKSRFPFLGITLHGQDWQGQKTYELDVILPRTG